MTKENIVIATIKPWNISNAKKFKNLHKNKYDVKIITNKKELTYQKMAEIQPKYIFFPHWSWIIPKDIYQAFKCIVFHMTDLPYGRGGSPLQNLIINKVYSTKISAIRVEEKLDAGKVYMKEELFIGLGIAEEIFQELSEKIFFKMMPYILENDPVPEVQKGKVVKFRRRRSEQSDISTQNISDLDSLYDFIRMLDAEGYPKAYLRIGKLKILFSEAHKKHERLVGRFTVLDDEK